MTFTKEQLVKEAVNTMLELDCNSSFELLSAVQAVKELLTRLGIGRDDVTAELHKRQNVSEDDGY